MAIIIDQNGRREISDDEYNSIMNNLNCVWNKTLHIQIINEFHTELFNSLIQEHNYISIGELSLWMQRPNSEYYNEAISIFNWFASTYSIIEQYALTVTEETKQEPEAFIASLPRLN
jgi:hypothetical protein